jgi:hypothetical protein
MIRTLGGWMRMTTERLLTGATLLLALAACSPEPDTTTAAVPAPTAEAMDSLLATASAGDSLAPPPVAATLDTSAAAALTLRDIGRKDGITLTGAIDAATITIPVNAGLRPARLDLALVATPRMPGATLALAQGGRILAIRALLDTTAALSFPLDEVETDRGRAPVELLVNIPGRDACEAPLFYRTVIKPTSTVTYTGRPAALGGVSGFFQPWVRRVTFYLPEQPSLDAAQVALDASAFVARRYRGMSTTFAIAALPDSGAIPEPAADERALVWGPNGPTMILRPEGGRGTVLAIASRRDARQLFTLADGPELVPTAGFSASTVRIDGDGTVESRTLGSLGFGPRTIDGSSVIVASYPFALADFGHVATPRAFRLVAQHSTLPPGGNGTLRIHLNDQLIHSQPLDRTQLDVTVPIPARALARDNRLEVRFNVMLGEGGCTLGGPVFTATIDTTSTFVLAPTPPLAPSFDRFPAALVPGFSVLLEPRDRFRVELASTLIGAMQATTQTPLVPYLVRDQAEVQGSLLAVGTGTLAQALDAPVGSDGFRLRDLQGRVWDEYAPTTSYGAMQAFARNGRDILLLHHTRENGQPLADLLAESLSPYGWFGVSGDLALRGAEAPTTVIRAANSGWKIESTAEGTPSFFAAWRSVIFIGAAVLLVALLLFFYPRVVRRELDPTG